VHRDSLNGGTGRRQRTAVTARAIARAPMTTVRIALRRPPWEAAFVSTSAVKRRCRERDDLAAICDVDESVLKARVGRTEKAARKLPAAFTIPQTARRQEDNRCPSIATPNHNHTVQAIWVVPGRKDRYTWRSRPLAYEHVRGEADCGRGAEV